MIFQLDLYFLNLWIRARIQLWNGEKLHLKVMVWKCYQLHPKALSIQLSNIKIQPKSTLKFSYGQMDYTIEILLGVSIIIEQFVDSSLVTISRAFCSDSRLRRRAADILVLFSSSLILHFLVFFGAFLLVMFWLIIWKFLFLRK